MQALADQLIDNIKPSWRGNRKIRWCDAASSRDEILQRVRQGVNKGDFAARRQAAEASLQAPVRGPQPNVSGDLTQRFADKAVSLASTVARVDSLDQVPGAVATFLGEQGLGRKP